MKTTWRALPWIIAVLAPVLFAGHVFTSQQETKISVPIFTNKPIAGKTGWACRTVMDAGVAVNLTSQKLEGSVTKKSQDDVAVSVQDNKLSFINSLSVKGGTTDTTGFTIVQNDDNNLVAIGDYNKTTSGNDMFLLHKKTGLAMWTVSWANFLGAPFGDVQYLQCQ